MHDFTPEQYAELINTLLPLQGQWRIMHHVDLRPKYALRLALQEHERCIQSTYYFRSMHIKPYAKLIESISTLGHKIGYHYESLATCHGNSAMAIEDFCHNLECLRKIAPVDTACAHGSPLSKWDSQTLWKQHDIHDYGITYEPMLDTDFSHTIYLTDTGHRWDGASVSIRDKVPGQQQLLQATGIRLHSSNDIISALLNPDHPIHHYHLLINTHPERWNPLGIRWLWYLILDYTKNIAKRIVVRCHPPTLPQ